LSPPTSKIFHGWRIVGAGAAIQFLNGCMLVHGFGAYVAALSAERGWSKTALSAGAAIQSIEGAVLGPLQGWLIDRFGSRRMVQGGLVVFALGMAALSQVETLLGFYGAMVLVALGASLSGYFPFTVTVMHWFRRQRARALSIMSLGLAVGGVAVPLVAGSIQIFGWRATAFGSGVLILLVGLPLTRVLHRRPSDVGEFEDGDPAPAPATHAAAEADGPAADERSFTASQALRTRAFWLLGLGHASAMLVVGSVNVHAISHIKEGLGYSLAQAALLITLMTIFQVAGVLGSAAVGDRWNKRLVATACMVGHMVGLLMLAYADHIVWLIGFAVVHGIAWGMRGPFMQALRADYFGVGAIGLIMGLSAFIIAAGQVAGPMVAGALHDLTGDYRLGFTVLALAAGAGSVLFYMARKPA